MNFSVRTNRTVSDSGVPRSWNFDTRATFCFSPRFGVSIEPFYFYRGRTAKVIFIDKRINLHNVGLHVSQDTQLRFSCVKEFGLLPKHIPNDKNLSVSEACSLVFRILVCPLIAILIKRTKKHAHVFATGNSVDSFSRFSSTIEPFILHKFMDYYVFYIWVSVICKLVKIIRQLLISVGCRNTWYIATNKIIQVSQSLRYYDFYAVYFIINIIGSMAFVWKKLRNNFHIARISTISVNINNKYYTVNLHCTINFINFSIIISLQISY